MARTPREVAIDLVVTTAYYNTFPRGDLVARLGPRALLGYVAGRTLLIWGVFELHALTLREEQRRRELAVALGHEPSEEELIADLRERHGMKPRSPG